MFQSRIMSEPFGVADMNDYTRIANNKPAEQSTADRPYNVRHNYAAGSIPTGTTGAPGAVTGSARQQFDTLVNQRVEAGDAPAAAVRAVVKAQPALHKRMLDEANPGRQKQ
jgi:hypothetical protein